MSILAFSLAGGAWVFLAVVMAFVVGAIYSLYTRKGSGINQHPYANQYSAQPGARIPNSLSHDRFAATNYTRGTR